MCIIKPGRGGVNRLEIRHYRDDWPQCVGAPRGEWTGHHGWARRDLVGHCSGHVRTPM